MFVFRLKTAEGVVDAHFVKITYVCGKIKEKKKKCQCI